MCFLYPKQDPTKVLDVTPYEFQKKRASKINYFKLWRCLAKVGILEPKKKIGLKITGFVFIGYILDSNTNRFFGDQF